MSKIKRTDKQNLPVHRPSKCTCTNVRRTSRAITKLYDAIMEPSGLKVTQFSVLRNIMVSGPLNKSELAPILSLDRTTLVRNIKSLEASKLIENVPGADTRMRSIAVTKAGRKAVENAIPYWQKAQKQIENRLGAENLEKLISLLMDIESAAE